MIRVNGLWNTILTLECWAHKIPLVFQAEEDYESDLGKKDNMVICYHPGGRERGWGLEDVVRVTIKFTRSPHKTVKYSYYPPLVGSKLMLAVNFLQSHLTLCR